jgi:cellulose synthase/poly-beta-1,6-N-acetylglucosamine synthase-like glycosyltransferase
MKIVFVIVSVALSAKKKLIYIYIYSKKLFLICIKIEENKEKFLIFFFIKRDFHRKNNHFSQQPCMLSCEAFIHSFIQKKRQQEKKRGTVLTS